MHNARKIAITWPKKWTKVIPKLAELVEMSSCSVSRLLLSRARFSQSHPVVFMYSTGMCVSSKCYPILTEQNESVLHPPPDPTGKRRRKQITVALSLRSCCACILQYIMPRLQMSSLLLGRVCGREREQVHSKPCCTQGRMSLYPSLQT